MRDGHLANNRDGRGVEFLHASDSTYRLMYEKRWMDIPSFAIVRHPIERLISASRILTPKVLKETPVWNEMSFLSAFNHANASQWIQRQAPQITAEKTKIWKYEWELGENFREWMEKEITDGTPIIEKDDEPEYSRFAYDFRPICVNDSLLEFAQEYYKEDMELFGYE